MKYTYIRVSISMIKANCEQSQDVPKAALPRSVASGPRRVAVKVTTFGAKLQPRRFSSDVSIGMFQSGGWVAKEV